MQGSNSQLSSEGYFTLKIITKAIYKLSATREN